MIDFLAFVLIMTPAIWATKYFYYLKKTIPTDSQLVRISFVFCLLFIISISLCTFFLTTGGPEYTVLFTKVRNIIKYTILSTFLALILPHIYIYFGESIDIDADIVAKEKMFFIISVTLLIFVTLFVVAPITMYENNAKELWFSITEILPVIFFEGIVVFLTFTVGLYLLPWGIARLIGALLFGMGIAFYVEGNIMPMDYGVLDGGAVDWGKHQTRILLDWLMWILCISVPVLIIKKNYKIIPIISIILIFMQTSTFVFIDKSIFRNKETYFLTNEEKFSLGSKENIILIVLDSVDSRMFEKAIKESQELKQVFKDFTYYPNCISYFQDTRPSIPFIMTGIAYDNTKDYISYQNSSYMATPILKILSENNYDTRFFTYDSLVPIINNTAHNIYIDNKSSVLNTNQKKILVDTMKQFVLMRYMPVSMKKIFWLNFNEFDRAKNQETMKVNSIDMNLDYIFYNEMNSQKININHEKTFRFYHFQGAHAPYNMDRELQHSDRYKAISWYADDFAIEQALGSFKIIAHFLKKIKENNVYDNATIIIVGDHGMSNDNNMAYHLSPVLLLKNKNIIQNSIYTSFVPASIGDVSGTIIETLLGENYEGESLNNINENNKRNRYFYRNYSNNVKNGHFSDMTEFVISEREPLPNNFVKTGDLLTPNGRKKHYYSNYSWGDNINFLNVNMKGINNRNYKPSNYAEWGVIGDSYMGSKDNFIHTAGKKSVFGFEIPNGTKDLIVTMVASSVVDQSLPQRLQIAVNDVRLSTEFVFSSKDFKKISFAIPRSLIQEDNILKLEFLLPDAKLQVDPYEKLHYYEESLLIESMVINEVD